MLLDSEIKKLLKKNNLKVTNARLKIAKYLWQDRKNKHVTVNLIYKHMIIESFAITQATIYNILKNFVECSLLNEISIENQPKFFDTNLENHSHLYYTDEIRLEDIIESSNCKSIDLPKNKILVKKSTIYYLASNH